MDTLKSMLNEGREIDRLVDHYKDSENMSKNALRDAIGQDLEMLEYTPTQIEALIPQLIRRIKS